VSEHLHCWKCNTKHDRR